MESLRELEKGILPGISASTLPCDRHNFTPFTYPLSRWTYHIHHKIETKSCELFQLLYFSTLDLTLCLHVHWCLGNILFSDLLHPPERFLLSPFQGLVISFTCSHLYIRAFYSLFPQPPCRFKCLNLNIKTFASLCASMTNFLKKHCNSLPSLLYPY